MKTEPVFIKAGQHRVSAAFVRRFDGPYEDLDSSARLVVRRRRLGRRAASRRCRTCATSSIRGPFKATGVSETPSRQKIFTCRPTSAAEERPCARTIVAHLGMPGLPPAADAGAEVDALLQFYDAGAAKNGFEGGVRLRARSDSRQPALHLPPRAAAETRQARHELPRVATIDLASRLSFFLWGAPPDQELLARGDARRARPKPGIEKQARRMLADPRAEALGTRFAGAVAAAAGHRQGPSGSELLPELRRQPRRHDAARDEMFFNSLVREDRSVLDLLSRGLHVPQRAARAALRHSRRRAAARSAR